MRNVRNAVIAVFVLAGAAAYATQSGIEVLRVSGIEVLLVETHSWGCPPGSTVRAVMDLGAGPVTASTAPVDPVTGNATVTFPMSHPNNRVELRNPAGVLLGMDVVTQFE